MKFCVKKNIKKSKESFLDFTVSETSPIKISGRCITADDVLENLGNVEEQKAKKCEKQHKKEKNVKKSIEKTLKKLRFFQKMTFFYAFFRNTLTPNLLNCTQICTLGWLVHNKCFAV